MTLRILFTVLVCATMFAKPAKSPQEIQSQINAAQIESAKAKKMFTPYYAGPLLAASAHNVPPDVFVLQPYLFFNTNYGVYDSNRKVDSTNSSFTLNPTAVMQTGILDNLDISFIPAASFSWKSKQSAQNINDTSLQLGWQLNKETYKWPAVRIVVGETFPSGKYENLNPSKGGIDATGAGGYTTLLGFYASKVFWFWLDHPVQIRTDVQFTMTPPIDVHNYNAYGGTTGTIGKVSPGNELTIDCSFEYSIVQQWVLACDFVYSSFEQTTFNGDPGLTSGGIQPTIGGPAGYVFSVAPAIEYNPSDSLQFIAGPWFTVTGKNTVAFANFIASFALEF